jgi:hypothetical protein
MAEYTRVGRVPCGTRIGRKFPEGRAHGPWTERWWVQCLQEYLDCLGWQRVGPLGPNTLYARGPSLLRVTPRGTWEFVQLMPSVSRWL